MDTLNTAPILEQIRADARLSADKLVQEAKNRASAISEFAAARVAQELEKTQSQAALEAGRLEDRMQRLNQLEERKELVSVKRALIDSVFAQALAQLNATPEEQVAQVMSGLLLKHAQGTEQLLAGDISGGFLTPAFVETVNNQLKQQGKPGKLTLNDRRLPGVCGLMLKGAHTEVHCTFAALLETRREELEAAVAEKLFPKTAH